MRVPDAMEKRKEMKEEEEGEGEEEDEDEGEEMGNHTANDGRIGWVYGRPA